MDTDDIRSKTFEIKLWEHCNPEEVRCRFASYSFNGTLAMELLCKVDSDIAEGFFEKDHLFCMPFGVVTVNLETSSLLPLNVQFVDENNMPGIGKWLESNGIAKATGVCLKSGYVTYRAFEFNVPKESLQEVESRRRHLGTLPQQQQSQTNIQRLK